MSLFYLIKDKKVKLGRIKKFSKDAENIGSFLLEALVVKIWWQRCWEEELKVADCSLHCDIKWTKEGSPLIQHLLSGRLRKVPVWTPSTS